MNSPKKLSIDISLDHPALGAGSHFKLIYYNKDMRHAEEACSFTIPEDWDGQYKVVDLSLERQDKK